MIEKHRIYSNGFLENWSLVDTKQCGVSDGKVRNGIAAGHNTYCGYGLAHMLTSSAFVLCLARRLKAAVHITKPAI